MYVIFCYCFYIRFCAQLLRLIRLCHIKSCWNASQMKNVFILTEKITKHMFVYTLPRGQDRNWSFLRSKNAWSRIYPWYLFLGELMLWLKVCKNLQIFLWLYRLNHFSRCLWVWGQYQAFSYILSSDIHSTYLILYKKEKL